VSGLATLIRLAERRADEAVLAWQRLKAQCDDAEHKLLLLHKHREGYRELMRTGLQHGVPAASIVAHIAFLGQIDAVVVRQKSELGQLDEACARQWDEFVDARRQKRMYEILRERISARDATTASRREQAELGELLQRAGRSAAVIGDRSGFDR
jgi:flagellar export protein FliJ